MGVWRGDGVSLGMHVYGHRHSSQTYTTHTNTYTHVHADCGTTNLSFYQLMNILCIQSRPQTGPVHS